ncbi:HAMP domain-containing histidine kinase [Novosphingobium profundi]|uniref:sensor histidine kinase n=1 Tax=Novosphingobium profundi TaxID=1774954 RepID=UPI001BD924D8|nr:sensor histidine kinase [Novosphingobium profundi]MBT0668538.1 HAMP domain-containing histidine kinase [Novosphingobium profundi]
MHFDDRLSTVLRHSANSGTLARIQFRQLVDILAQAPADLSSELAEEGYARLDSLCTAIRTPEQVDLIRQSLLRLTNPRLLAQLAAIDPKVASVALAKTRLDEDAWLALIPALPVHARGILRHRRDLPSRVNDLLERLGIGDRALPPAAPLEAVSQPPREDAIACAPTRHDPGILDTAQVQAPPCEVRQPRTEAEVEELVLTTLLGSEDPAPHMPPHRVASAGAATPVSPSGLGAGPPPPPRSPDTSGSPAHAVPTSLREWARLRAAGTIAPPPDPLQSTSRGDPGIGAIVRRIEEFRRNRQKPRPPEPANDSPRLPLGDAPGEVASGPATIDFATDSEGRINWADGPFAPAVTGFSLPAHESLESDIAAAVRQRLPIRGALIALAGPSAISGLWQVDAAACFDQSTGRFTGHCGRLRRPRTSSPEIPAGAASAEADRMRQVLHELRTPANAIQVAAEIIQQQLYGPAPHEYRALAASIAGDCAHILAGFEELDRLVKLETGALQLDPGLSNLARITAQTIRRLGGWTGPRNSGFAPSPDLDGADLPIALAHDEAERLVWRLLAALAGASVSDERLALEWSDEGPFVRMRLALPAALAEREGDALFAIGEAGRGQALSAGVFGVGFTLRLACAEAASCGGSLQRIANDLVLTLPLSREANDIAPVADHRP